MPNKLIITDGSPYNLAITDASPYNLAIADGSPNSLGLSDVLALSKIEILLLEDGRPLLCENGDMILF